MRQFALFTLLSVLFLPALVASMRSPNRHKKRITHTGKGTWFDVGLGACGETNTNNDKIVALPPAIYANGVHCNKKVAVTANGKTAYATVRDKCPGCGGSGLDMSPSMFENFAELSVGEVEVSWYFTGA